MEEVRYHLLRPSQIVQRRNACPVAYVPLGTIEWHGLHNPTGADALQAEALAILCAQKGGGLAFPPLYYGESRCECLVEANVPEPHRSQLAKAMDLPPENFNPERQPFTPTEQALNYQKLLIHILAELESLGFKLGVFVAGHYPLIDHATAAALLFNKREYSRKHGMLAWAFMDAVLLRDRYECAGDHAGGWETSHMMATHPETVDLSTLPPKGQPLIAASGRMAPQDANAEFGRKIFEEAADIAVKEVHHRLDEANRVHYLRHGGSFRDGLWKTREA